MSFEPAPRNIRAEVLDYHARFVFDIGDDERLASGCRCCCLHESPGRSALPPRWPAYCTSPSGVAAVLRIAARKATSVGNCSWRGWLSSGSSKGLRGGIRRRSGRQRKIPRLRANPQPCAQRLDRNGANFPSYSLMAAHRSLHNMWSCPEESGPATSASDRTGCNCPPFPQPGISLSSLFLSL